MSSAFDIEIRPDFNCTPKERALARDSFVREFERRFNDWSEIAKICYEVERDQDYLLLGYKSFHQWILAVAPKSRAYIYLVTGRYKELRDDFTDDELSQIDLDSTNTLRKLSPAVRRDPEVREAAKKKPRELRQKVIERFPNQHLEEITPRVQNFTTSQAEVFDEALAVYRALNNHEASVEEFVEWMCADYMNSGFDDLEEQSCSRRDRARQLEGL
jgi:hypothetical protein